MIWLIALLLLVPLPASAEERSVTIAAVGDIQCGPTTIPGPGMCESEQVAQLVKDANVTNMIALGDLQYQNGTYEEFVNEWDPVWGDLKDKTLPVIGNHEWNSKADGYRRYFGKAASDSRHPFYRWERRVNDWQILGIDSDCDQISCRTTGTQYHYLENRLSHEQECTIVAFHHPLYSSNAGHTEKEMAATWKLLREYDVDIVLNGHVHAYERMAKLNAKGKPYHKGIRSFIVGTGGKSHHHVPTVDKRSKYTTDHYYGALFLTLNDGSYSWEFKTPEGEVLDSGTDGCD